MIALASLFFICPAKEKKVVSIISRDKLKAQTYCEIAELNADMAGCLFRKTEVDRSATLFNPSCCENLFCIWRGEICEKCVRRVCGGSIAHERRSVARIVLNVRWQRTDQLEALWFE